MPGWIIAAAVGSIVVTALLTFVLWRMNAPLLAQAKQERADTDAGDGNLHTNTDGTESDGAEGGGGGGGD